MGRAFKSPFWKLCSLNGNRIGLLVCRWLLPSARGTLNLITGWDSSQHLCVLIGNCGSWALVFSSWWTFLSLKRCLEIARGCLWAESMVRVVPQGLGWRDVWDGGSPQEGCAALGAASSRKAWLGTLARTVRARILKVYFTTALNICMRLQKSIKSIFGIASWKFVEIHRAGFH